MIATYIFVCLVKVVAVRHEGRNGFGDEVKPHRKWGLGGAQWGQFLTEIP